MPDAVFQLVSLFSIIIAVIIGIVAIEGWNNSRGPMAVFGILVIIGIFSGREYFERQGGEDVRPPNLSSLCKGNQNGMIEVSWKVPRKDFEKFKEIVTEKAGCRISVLQLNTPPPFRR